MAAELAESQLEAVAAKLAEPPVVYQNPILHRVLLISLNSTLLNYTFTVDIIQQKVRLKMTEPVLNLEDVGNRRMSRRKKLGLTQEALAEKSDVTTQFVSYAESGKRAMRPENLIKISNALNVSVDYLLSGDIIDKDIQLLSAKIEKLTPSEVRIIESIIDECLLLYHCDE